MIFATFSQIAQAVQSAIQSILPTSNFGVGTIWQALTNVIADTSQYNSALTQQALVNARILTATGPALDLIMADYEPAGFSPRMGATQATGLVTFTQAVSSSSSLIPLGAILKTADGTVSFQVTANLSDPYWNAGMGGYLLPPGSTSDVIPVQALVAGSSSNVLANTISTIATSMAASFSVNNTVGITNGLDAESDQALRTRFWQFLNTRSQATAAAVDYAISSVQQGLTYNILVNQNAQGVGRQGYYLVVVDDGTGAPSAALQASVLQAISAVNPLSVSYAVSGPNVVMATISLSVIVQPGYSHQTVAAQVDQAISTYVAQLGVSTPCRISGVYGAALGVDGVAYIENLTVNGGTADIGGGPADSVHVSNVAVG